nr:immunoglobulin light chain junction region [Macaca mulatta]
DYYCLSYDSTLIGWLF